MCVKIEPTSSRRIQSSATITVNILSNYAWSMVQLPYMTEKQALMF